MALPVILRCRGVLMCSWAPSRREEMRNRYIYYPQDGLWRQEVRGHKGRQRGGGYLRMNQTIHRDPVSALTLGFSPRHSANYNFLLPPPFSPVPPSDWQQFKPVKSHQGTGGLSSRVWLTYRPTSIRVRVALQTCARLLLASERGWYLHLYGEKHLGILKPAGGFWEYGF